MGLRAIVGEVVQGATQTLQPQGANANTQTNTASSQNGQPTSTQADEAIRHMTQNLASAPTEFEQDVRQRSEHVSDTYDMGVRVRFPKPAEQMSYDDYVTSYLRAMFQANGMSDVTDGEIAKFQANLAGALGDNFGVDNAASRETATAHYRQKQHANGNEAIWATNERGRVYVDAGMRDIFRQREARADRTEQIREQAQHESTEMLLDSGRVMANSVINLGNASLQMLSMQPEYVPGVRDMQGNRVANPNVPQLPKFEYQSEMFRRDGRTIETGTTIGAGVLMARGKPGTPQSLNIGRTEAATTEAAEASKVPAGLRVPQGLTEEQFARFSARVREEAGRYGTDIRVHGSRATGTAGEGSDIDVAIRVTPERFNQILRERFGNPSPGSAAERTMRHAIETGKIHRRPLGLSNFGKAIEQEFGKEVDISVIRAGGQFDQGPWTPLR